MGKTTEDIEMLLIVSLSGTRKGVFQITNFEKKKIILKLVTKCYFLPQIGNLTFENDK